MASLDGGADVSDTPDRVKRFFDQRKRAEEGTWTMPESMAPGSTSRARDLQRSSFLQHARRESQILRNDEAKELGPIQWSGQFAPRPGMPSAARLSVLRYLARGGAALSAFVGFILIPSAVPAGIFFLSASILFASTAIYVRNMENQSLDNTIFDIEDYGVPSNVPSSNSTFPITK